MKNAVLVCVVNSTRYLRDYFHRAPYRHWVLLGKLIKLAAFDEFHAEVTRAVALADFIDGNDARMIQAGGGFGFAAESLQMRFSGPMSQTNHLESYRAVQTFLPRAIYDSLAAAADFLQQFVVAKVGECLWPTHCSRHR